MNTDTFSPLTDRKKIRVGKNWFLMKFFADGTIEKYCWEDNHEVIADFEAKYYSCKLCDWIQA